MDGERSRWRNRELWQERLQSDHAALEEHLDEEQAAALDGVVQLFESDAEFELRFFVVYGSRATGLQAPGSDLDLWIEATIPRERPFRFGGFDTMLFPHGALAGALHQGQDFARRVAGEAVIWADPDGWFREVVIAADELPLQ